MQAFLKEHAGPGKARISRLYEAFKREPKTEGICKPRFLAELARAGVQVVKARGKLYAIGLSIDSTDDRPGVWLRKKPERTDVTRLCGKCGGPVHPAYWYGTGSSCEDCLASYWDDKNISGAKHRYWAMQVANDYERNANYRKHPKASKRSRRSKVA